MVLFIVLKNVVLRIESVDENPSNENYIHLKVFSLAQYVPVKLIITLYKVAQKRPVRLCGAVCNVVQDDPTYL